MPQKDPPKIDSDEVFGPYLEWEPVRYFNEISRETIRIIEDVEEIFLEKDFIEKKFQIFGRLLYLYKTTSVSLRLCASWSSTLPALVLLRCRYEQVVRFSHLVLSGDNFLEQFEQAGAYQKQRVARNAVTDGIDKYAEEFIGEGYFSEILSGDEIDRSSNYYLTRNLKVIAGERDLLAKESVNKFSRYPLEVDYVAVYNQFSSIIHSDALVASDYLQSHKNRDGVFVLAPSPNWTVIAQAFCARYDLIQAIEFVEHVLEEDVPSALDDLVPIYEEGHHRLLNEFTIPTEHSPKK